MKSWTMAFFLVTIVFITPFLEALQKKCRKIDQSQKKKSTQHTTSQEQDKDNKTEMDVDQFSQKVRQQLYQEISNTIAQLVTKFVWWIAELRYGDLLNEDFIEYPPESRATKKQVK